MLPRTLATITREISASFLFVPPDVANQSIKRDHRVILSHTHLRNMVYFTGFLGNEGIRALAGGGFETHASLSHGCVYLLPSETIDIQPVEPN